MSSAVPLMLAILALGQGKPVDQFPPLKGKTLVAVGSVWHNEAEAYTKATGHRPHGHKIWVGLNNAADVSFFGQMADRLPKDDPYRFLAISVSFTPNFPKEGSPGFPDHRADLYSNGSRDEFIRLLGEAIKKFGKTVFVDLGNEHDLMYRDQREQWMKTCKYIHDKWKEQNVINAVYVWHLAMSTDTPELWYPGDSYVDVVGFSFYWYEGQIERANQLVGFARLHKKPLAIYEFGYNPKVNTKCNWSNYFQPTLELIQKYDVRLFVYNNTEDVLGDFKNSRMDLLPPEYQQAWGNAMRGKRYHLPERSK